MITISLILIAKVLATIAIAGFSAMFCLWPINDQPTSITQFVIWVLIMALVIAELFYGVPTINITM